MHQSIENADVCEIVDIEALYLRIHIVLEKRKIVGRHQSPSKEVDFCVVYLQFCWKICVRLHMFNMELGSNKRRQIVQRTIFEFINEIGLTRQKKKQLPQSIPNTLQFNELYFWWAMHQWAFKTSLTIKCLIFSLPYGIHM